MITIIPIASSSSGNSMLVRLDGRTLLIDAGITLKLLNGALQRSGLSLQDIDALFITHTHSDHVKGLEVIGKRLSCPMFMSGITKERLYLDSAVALMPYTKTEFLPGLSVTLLPTSHDCDGSAGFLIESCGSRLGYITDLGFVSQEIMSALTGADCIVIESNHDEQMLKDGPYPFPLKRRILSDSGHLSNAACAEALRFFAASGTKQFVLAHLSKENNTPSKAAQSAGEALDGTGCSFYVLPMFGGETIEV